MSVKFTSVRRSVLAFRRRFGLVGNVTSCINKVNERGARLALGWVTVGWEVYRLGM